MCQAFNTMKAYEKKSDTIYIYLLSSTPFPFTWNGPREYRHAPFVKK